MFIGNILFYNVLVIVTLIRVPSSVEANTGANYWKNKFASWIDKHKIRPAGLVDYPDTRLQLIRSNITKIPLTRRNVQKALVVLIDICGFGTVAAALATSLAHFAEIEDVDPLAAPYYTRAYRWLTRHFDAYPHFLQGREGYITTHQMFDARPTYNRKYIPEWMKKVFFPFISEEKWKKEEEQEKLFEPNIVNYLKEIPTLVNATGIGDEKYNPYYGIWPKPRGLLGKAADAVKGLAKGVGNLAKGAAKGVGDLTKGAAKGAGNLAKGAAKGVGNLAKGAAKGVGNLAKGVGQGVGNLAKGVGNLAKDLNPFGG